MDTRLAGRLSCALAVGTLLLLGACSSNVPREAIRYSIEELGSEVADRAAGQGQEYRTAISITGISIPHAVGQMVTVPEDVLRSEMPDLLATPVSPTCSRIVETKYELPANSDGAAIVASLAAGLEQVAAIYVSVAAARTRLAIASAGLDRAKAINDSAKIKEDGQSKLAASALGLPEPSQDGFSTKQLEAQKTLLEQQAALAKALTEFQALKRTPNVVITRWSRSEQSAATAGIGSWFGIGEKGRRERKGFLVLAGLRTSTLAVGNDILYRIRTVYDDKLTGASSAFDKAYFTLFSLSARHVAFTEEADLEQVLSLSLNLKPEQLRQILGGGLNEFLLAQSISVEAMLARALTAGTFGSLRQSKFATRTTPWSMSRDRTSTG